MLKGLATFALLGFTLSALSHVCAWFGMAGPLGAASWLLHAGIFIVWVPTVLLGQVATRNVPSKDIWRAMFLGAPAWMKRLTYGIFGYAVLHFIVFILLGAPRRDAASAGMPPAVVRGFSGHWMAFYAAAFTTMFARLKRGAPAAPRCSQGHPVSPFAAYCEAYGAPTPRPPQHPE